MCLFIEGAVCGGLKGNHKLRKTNALENPALLLIQAPLPAAFASDHWPSSDRRDARRVGAHQAPEAVLEALRPRDHLLRAAKPRRSQVLGACWCNMFKQPPSPKISGDPKEGDSNNSCLNIFKEGVGLGRKR